MRNTEKIAHIISLVAALCICCFADSHAADVTESSDKWVALSNDALKKFGAFGEPDFSAIKKLLLSYEYQRMDKLYDDIYQLYKKDVNSEGVLDQAYSLFSPDSDVSLDDLDLWVAKTGSYVAYAARGIYKTRLGFKARGSKYINETPESSIEEMERLHKEAAKDLEIAINKNPGLMPAYRNFMSIASASRSTFTTKQLMDKTEENDKRTFSVRYEYMTSLQPKWGGSYEEMAKFAQHAIQYVNLNPRLWSFQGEISAYHANQFLQVGDYASAADSYTEALKFGDRVMWLRARAGCYERLGKNDRATMDYRRVLQYLPSDKTAQAFLTRDKDVEQQLVYDLKEDTSVDPKISGLNIKTYALLGVYHHVDWLNTRADKGNTLIYNNTVKIERMLRRLGYDCIERSRTLDVLETQKVLHTTLTNEQAHEAAKALKVDAYVIATIPSMGRDQMAGKLFEDIEIKAMSTATGRVIWDTTLKGSVVVEQDKYNPTLILDTMETKLYDVLMKKLRTEINAEK